MIDIKSYKEKFEKFEENSVIQNLFNIHKDRVDELIKFGFKFNYGNRCFEAMIEINGNTHTINIFRTVLETERLVKYCIRFSPIDARKYQYLSGAYSDFELYYSIEETYCKLNHYAIFNHIYTVYRLNQKEEKDTFKQFVSNEKENDKEDIQHTSINTNSLSN